MSDIIVGNRSSLMPTALNDKLLMAKQIAESGLAPQGLKTPQQVFVALQWGHELGLSPMVAVSNISVINGKPTLSADIMFAIVRSHHEYAGCSWKKNDDHNACVEIRRKTGEYIETYIGYFSIPDAQKAGLMQKDVWKKYPSRMLKHRALSYACRDAFPDALAGIYTPEEIRNVTPDEPPEPEMESITVTVSETHCENDYQMRYNRIVEDIVSTVTDVAADGTGFFSDDEFEWVNKKVAEAPQSDRGADLLESLLLKLQDRLSERKKEYQKRIAAENIPKKEEESEHVFSEEEYIELNSFYPDINAA